MSALPTIEIGVPGNKVRVPRIGLGTMGMSSFYGPVDDAESLKVLNHAIDMGCTFWDTADLYGAGHNERLLGQVLKTRRDEVFLCTKFGVAHTEAGPDFVGNFDKLVTGYNSKPDYVRSQVEKSLGRLGIDQIDLYYQHRVDPNTPIEETVGAMAGLVKEGKVRYIGLSECSADELRRAYKIHPIAAVEIEYSPWSTHIETSGLLDACRELGVTVVAYSPLGRGFMTGQIRSIDDLDKDDWRRSNPRFKPEHFANNLKLVDAFESLAKKRGCRPGQVALAWLMAQEKNLIVIPGTKRIKYLDENLGAGQITLTEEEIKALREFVDAANVQGERY
ncbi:hypothetical protein H4218_005744 [Coemansia sp. IMI 209128]|uniref:NADP-dependent oxidoreductase domain-containing protein n=1 Tax=Coemansia spiralis TaxID=417178 RepID=A0A9W8GEY4_9FUNG|nr:hypothetical protein GGI10_002324 [Coemansia sp. RSA 2530]KAJ2683921.1 hypothetical protein IWW39_005215 [Coemansia spiralis]KAJ2694159.1 hypothetical protein H4218_005744 [Coemansia sp. IMI 209128]